MYNVSKNTPCFLTVTISISYVASVAKCTSDDYNKLYEAAHNNKMNKAKKLVENKKCCPSKVGGTYSGSALWVAGIRGNTAMVAYLKTVNCGKSLTVLFSMFAFKSSNITLS